ncbi:helicase HerA domain-containing protein, partial [Staphylococcus pseudintermedius]
MAIFKKNKQEKATSKIHNESFQKITEVLDTDSVDSIYPFSWIEKKSHIETGENYIKNLLVVDYPQSVKGAYLSNLLKKNGNIQITKFIRPANIERMIDHLNNSIKNKTAEQMRTTDPKRNATIKREIESSKKQLAKFLDEKTGFMYMYMYITLNGDSYEKIQALEKDVKRTLTRLRLKTHTPTNAMRESFHTVLPLNRNFLSAFTQQNMDTATAGHFFMFDDSEIIDLTPNTSVFGINKNTDSLVAVDFNNKEKTLNKNMTIIGTSGVGKSTLNMRIILDNVKKSIRQFIIDPEDEFSYITKYYGGTVVNISTSSNIKINPFEIFSEEVFEKEDETDNETISDVLTENNKHESPIDTLVRSKIGKLKTFFRVLKDEISQTEISVLSSTLRQLYQDKGFKGNAKLSDFKSEDYPTLTELYNKLKDLDPEKYEV